MKQLSLIILTSLSISSCSTMINGFYKDLDKDKNSGPKRADNFDMYRKSYTQQNSNPRQFPTVQNSSNTNRVLPSVQRNYQPQTSARRRYKASDLVDNTKSGSIWAVAGKENFLFSTDSSKQRGDIVIVNVFDKLKNEISVELKRTFPDPPKKEQKEGEGEQAQNRNTAASPPASAPQPQAQNPAPGAGQVIDRVSAVVIEEINKNHLLLKGRKQVLYKGQKRTVELHALVNRRDITDNDEVSSKQILESTISVIR